MRHLKVLGLCLVAMFAVAALVASSATAGLPEFGQCNAKEGGKYANAGCTKKAKKGTGAFEWVKATALSEAAKTLRKNESVVDPGILRGDYIVCSPNRTRQAGSCESHGEVEEGGELETECENEFHHGKIVGTKEVKVGVAFIGCKALGSIPCSNGPIEGEIITNSLGGYLGYINKAAKEVGLLLTPEKKHGTFASFNCGGVVAITVGQGDKEEGTAYKESNGSENKGGNDSIISPITPVNEMSAEFKQVYTMNSEFENVPNKFEKKPRASLESFYAFPFEPGQGSKWSRAGESITTESHSEEGEGEIKA